MHGVARPRMRELEVVLGTGRLADTGGALRDAGVGELAQAMLGGGAGNGIVDRIGHEGNLRMIAAARAGMPGARSGPVRPGPRP